MSQNRFPPGWDEERVRRLIERYESQTEDEAVAEDEAALEELSGLRRRNGRRAVRVRVSVPEPLLREAERVRRHLRISRSQLFGRALELFLRREPVSRVTRQLDSVYGTAATDALDLEWQEASLEALRRVEWTDY